MSSKEVNPSSDPELERALGAFVDKLGTENLRSLSGLLPRPRGSEQPGEDWINGEFELHERIGSGSMGVVYEATQHSAAGRRVALKRLHPRRLSRQQRDRFRREIAVVSRLTHPNIVPLIASGFDGERPYFAMQLVDGVPLSQLISELRRLGRVPQEARELEPIVGSLLHSLQVSGSDKQDGQWSGSYWSWVGRVGMQIASALQHAHEEGVVHRDVKPGNIMITRSGVAILTDFGLARDSYDETLTEDGAFLGTLAYASPEQIKGNSVGSRSDVFSLGVALHELLALHRPFDASSRSGLEHAICHEMPLELPRAVPRDIRTICSKAISKSPNRRYATPGRLSSDLGAWLAGRPIIARPLGRLALTLDTVRRHPRAMALLGVVLAWLGTWNLVTWRAADALVQEAGDHNVRKRELIRELEPLLVKYYACFEPGYALHGEFFRRAENWRILIESKRADVDAASLAEESALHRASEHRAGFKPARAALAKRLADELEFALKQSKDVTSPDEVRELELGLKEYDDTGEYSWLMDNRGRMGLTCSIPGARASVFRAGEPVSISGPSPRDLPLQMSDLPEGLYWVELEAPGYLSTSMPVLVRRDACYVRGTSLPPQQHRIRTMVRPGELPSGFIFIPEGWTLMEPEPARWEFVDAFAIARYEETNAQWLQFLNYPGRIGPRMDDLGTRIRFEKDEPGFKPRWGTTSDELHVEWIDGRWQFKADFDLQLPVRGLDQMEMSFYATEVGCFREPAPSGWGYDLPRVSEWKRAARGADARTFPWGMSKDVDLPNTFLEDRSGTAESGRPQYIRVGQSPLDVSVFGVHDMGGSVSEACVDAYGPTRGESAVCGGSSESYRMEDLMTSTVLARPNEAKPSIGLRLVCRPRITYPEPDRDGFSDTFERSDNPLVGEGWDRAVGNPLTFPRVRPSQASCRIEAGVLICEGGKGEFSTASSVFWPFRMGQKGVLLRGQVNDSSDGFGRQFWVRSNVDALQATKITLGPTGADLATLGVLEHGRGVPHEVVRTSRQLTCLSGLQNFELSIMGNKVEARVWPAAAERPQDPFSLALRRPLEGTCFFGMTGIQNSSCCIGLEQIQVTPID